MYPFIIYTLSAIVIGVILYEVYWLASHSYKAVKAGQSTQPFSNAPSAKEAQILIVGDSTAYGVGSSSPNFSLAGQLALDFPSYKIFNASKNGTNLEHTLSVLTSLQGNTFNTILIQTGGIDTLTFTPLRKLTSLMQKSLAAAKLLEAEHVVVVSVNNAGSVPFFHIPLSYLFSYRSRSLSKLYEKIVPQNGGIHIPLFRELAEDPLAIAPQKYFSKDAIHPNDAGYKLWYDKIKPTFTKLLLNQS